MPIKRIVVAMVGALAAAFIAAYLLGTGPFANADWTLYPPLSALGATEPDISATRDQHSIVTVVIGIVVGLVIYAVYPGKKTLVAQLNDLTNAASRGLYSRLLFFLLVCGDLLFLYSLRFLINLNA